MLPITTPLFALVVFLSACESGTNSGTNHGGGSVAVTRGGFDMLM